MSGFQLLQGPLQVFKGVLEAGGQVGAERALVVHDQDVAGARGGLFVFVELGLDFQVIEGVLEGLTDFVFADAAEKGAQVRVFL